MRFAEQSPAAGALDTCRGRLRHGSDVQFARMRPGSPFGEQELVFDAGWAMSAVTEMPAATQTQAGTQRMTYREALRMAMREEMSATIASF